MFGCRYKEVRRGWYYEIVVKVNFDFFFSKNFNYNFFLCEILSKVIFFFYR